VSDNKFPLPAVSETEMPQIHRAMFAAKVDMPDIAKNGSMPLGGKTVNFTKIDDIRAALYPILERYGIMTYLEFVDQDSQVTVADPPLTMAQKEPAKAFHPVSGELVDNPRANMLLDSGRPVGDGKIPSRNIRVQVTYDIRFVYVGDNSSVVVRTIGESMDTSSDKATNKATTSAVKRAFVETFAIVDHTELEPDADQPEERNRTATTDRRDGSAAPAGDRGAQQRTAASGTGAGSGGTRRSGPQAQPAVAKPVPAAEPAPAVEAEPVVDQATGEVADEPEVRPEPAEAPDLDKLGEQKARVREFNKILQLNPIQTNELATRVTGREKREDWIQLPTAVKKLADEMQRLVEEQK